MRAGRRGLQDQRLVEALRQPGVLRREVAADRRQRQVEQEHLHDQRRAAEERHVEAGDGVRHRVAREPGQGAEQGHHDGQHDAADRDDHRVAETAEDVAEVVPDPLRRRSRRRCRGSRAPRTARPRRRRPSAGTAPAPTRAGPAPRRSAHRVARHSWVVRSRPYHSSENAVSVPSSCISADDLVHGLVEALRRRVGALVEADRRAARRRPGRRRSSPGCRRRCSPGRW